MPPKVTVVRSGVSTPPSSSSRTVGSARAGATTSSRMAPAPTLVRGAGRPLTAAAPTGGGKTSPTRHATTTSILSPSLGLETVRRNVDGLGSPQRRGSLPTSASAAGTRNNSPTKRQVSGTPEPHSPLPKASEGAVASHKGHTFANSNASKMEGGAGISRGTGVRGGGGGTVPTRTTSPKSAPLSHGAGLRTISPVVPKRSTPAIDNKAAPSSRTVSPTSGVKVPTALSRTSSPLSRNAVGSGGAANVVVRRPVAEVATKRAVAAGVTLKGVNGSTTVIVGQPVRKGVTSPTGISTKPPGTVSPVTGRPSIGGARTGSRVPSPLQSAAARNNSPFMKTLSAGKQTASPAAGALHPPSSSRTLSPTGGRAAAGTTPVGSARPKTTSPIVRTTSPIVRTTSPPTASARKVASLAIGGSAVAPPRRTASPPTQAIRRSPIVHGSEGAGGGGTGRTLSPTTTQMRAALGPSVRKAAVSPAAATGVARKTNSPTLPRTASAAGPRLKSPATAKVPQEEDAKRKRVSSPTGLASSKGAVSPSPAPAAAAPFPPTISSNSAPYSRHGTLLYSRNGTNTAPPLEEGEGRAASGYVKTIPLHHDPKRGISPPKAGGVGAGGAGVGTARSVPSYGRLASANRNATANEGDDFLTSGRGFTPLRATSFEGGGAMAGGGRTVSHSTARYSPNHPSAGNANNNSSTIHGNNTTMYSIRIDDLSLISGTGRTINTSNATAGAVGNDVSVSTAQPNSPMARELSSTVVAEVSVKSSGRRQASDSQHAPTPLDTRSVSPQRAQAWLDAFEQCLRNEKLPYKKWLVLPASTKDELFNKWGMSQLQRKVILDT